MTNDLDFANVFLNVLILEDSLIDFELLRENLYNAGFQLKVSHVDTEADFRQTLKNEKFHIILSDYRLPGFDAFGALDICLEICPKVPFICVSGSIGEETAIELLKKGAVDYVLKDRPERLPFAIKRALREVKEKESRLKVDRALKKSENRFRQVAETAQVWIWEVDSQGLYTYSSPVIETILGYTPAEVVGKMYFYDLYPAKEKEALQKIAFKTISRRGIFKNFVNSHIHKNGRKVYISTSGSPVFDDAGNFVGYRGADEDITERRNSEELLRQNEKKFRDLFHNHTAVKLIWDPKSGRIVEANKAAEKFYGWSREVLQTMNIKKIKQSNNSEKPQELLSKLTKRNDDEFQHKKADGSLVEVKVFSSRIEIKGKEYLHSIVHDISERKKVEQKLKLLNRAVEASSVSVIITDAERTINYVNPYFTKLTGYSYEETIGKNPRFLQSGNQPRAFYENLWKTISSGKDWSGEFLNKKKNGELFWENGVISPIMNDQGKITHFVNIKEDITERKKMLEDLVAAKEKAEESDRLKTAFINNISHEVRTPLNGILGLGHLMAEFNLPAEKRREYYKQIKSSSERLLNTITDYMDMAMIVSKTLKVEKEEFSLAPVFSAVLEKGKLLSKGKNLIFEGEIPKNNTDLVIHSNPELIQKILNKLLDNAFKFTREGRILCGYRIKPNHIEFYVEDTGSGIDSDKLSLIFEMFSQEDVSMTREYEGSGLGLAIAKALGTIIGGKLTATSKKGKGSKFTFTLPYKQDRKLKGQIIKDAKSTGVSPLILVAEDDKLNYLFLKTLLDSSGYQYIRAINGLEAVNYSKQFPDISIVLMDIQMPIMNGIEATRQIRDIRPDLPIIATTAHAQTGDKRRFLEAGCIDYLSKPIKNERLLELLQKYAK